MNDFGQFDQPSITTDFLANGVRYRLPCRRLGRARHFGWILLGFGLIMSMLMIGWMAGPLVMGIKDLQRVGNGGWLSIAFSGFGLIGLVPAVGMLLGGLAIVCNRTRCEVEVRGAKVYVKERFFFARMRRKHEAAGIRELRISDASSYAKHAQPAGDGKHAAKLSLGDSDNALVAMTGGSGKFVIAAAYPRDLLMQLAEELARRLEVDVSAQAIILERDSSAVARHQPDSPRVAVVEGPLIEDELAPIPDQPANSMARIARHDFGITIEIPPVGLRKGSKGLFFFALIWNLVMSIFFIAGVLAMLGVLQMEGDNRDGAPLAFGTLFLAIGVGLMVAAVNMGRRHATIATADDMMMIVRHSIFGKTTREWSVSQIDEIRCGNSGMEVNNVPVQELQVIPRGENKFGCLSQLDDDELRWIAGELNRALGIQRRIDRRALPATEVQRDGTGFIWPQLGSRVHLERTIDGLRIDVPPIGLLKYVGLVLFGILFAVVGAGVAIGINWDVWEHGIEKLELGEAFISAAFLLGFGSMGIAITCAGLVAGRRRFQLIVGDDELTLIRSGPFLRKSFRWHRDDLDSITVKDSGTQVNGRSLYQVFVQSRKSESVGFMTGHERTDLTLVATALCESLALDERQG